MKVAVYTIAKDEEHNVAGWLDSAGADFTLILDTGSKDGTVHTAYDLGVDKILEAHIRPFRFDLARNIALSMLPEDTDICLSVDMDERLTPGWREAVEKSFVPPWPTEGCLYRVPQIFSWADKERTVPGIRQSTVRGHSRFGVQWKGIVHEFLTGGTEVRDLSGLEIHHYPSDHPRPYLEYLKRASHEDRTARSLFYLAREYSYVGQWGPAKATALQFLAHPEATYNHERAAAYRIIGQAEDFQSATPFLKSVQEAPNMREGFIQLAIHYKRRTNWEGQLWASGEAIKIKEREKFFYTEPWAWGPMAYEFWVEAALALKMDPSRIRPILDEGLSVGPSKLLQVIDQSLMVKK